MLLCCVQLLYESKGFSDHKSHEWNVRLLPVIRASQIDDKKLMDNASVEQVCDFFIYAKEVHKIIANQRSATTGRMCSVIFANDIVGVRKPPDKRFSQALTSSSNQYESLYPSLAGPTMILNLPFILQAFVGLLKPVFVENHKESTNNQK